MQGAPAFTGKFSVLDYYNQALAEVTMTLNSMSDDKVLANDVAELQTYFEAKHLLAPLQPDFSSGGMEGKRQGSVAIVRVPLVASQSNHVAVDLRANPWPIHTQIEQIASLQADGAALIFECVPEKLEAMLRVAQNMTTLINRDIATDTPAFKERVAHAIQQRRWSAREQIEKFNNVMGQLGIRVTERPGALQPINVSVKREIHVLREAPPKPEGPSKVYIEPDSLDRILRLVDQAGKGFELTPATYTRLGEEDLRNIIIGYLNAVFNSNVASGETFSKRGQTDILLNVPGDAILICECKYWSGPHNYVGAVEQLFGYLTCRHSVAVMITFSRNKTGLSSVIAEADRAVRESASCFAAPVTKGDTYRVSTHRHPADPEKRVELHQLFFDLYSAVPTR
jgi:hypothetical protein